jgi:amino acid transporter
MSLIVGIVVGTSIFRAPPLVFQQIPAGGTALAVWFVGGLLSLMGALSYAELTTTFRQRGGEYHYLTLAYGPLVGFLFGWAQLTVVLTGSMGTMAYTFADYAARLAPALADRTPQLALAALVGLSALNLLNVHMGRWTQNVLTTAKVLGLAGVLIAALMASVGSERPVTPVPALEPGTLASRLGLALIFVLYAYGGWNDAAMVASEVQEPHRNLPRALCGGILAITVLYLLMNAAYLAALGVERTAASTAPAADVLALGFAQWGLSRVAESVISLLVMISALGALNGMLVTGGRMLAAWGTRAPGFAWLTSTPSQAHRPLTRPILLQTGAAGLMIWIIGTATGRSWIDGALHQIGLRPLAWHHFQGGFDLLVAATAPAFWTFFTLSVASVVILRWRYPDTPRPFAVPGYPFPVLIFAATCLFMLYSALDYARTLCLIGLVPLVPGLLWALVSHRHSPANQRQTPPPR